VLELFAIPYSTWSEKARWALDYHEIEYKESAYVPLLGELGLRKRIGTWSGKISVPLLVTAEGPVFDSFQIAMYAERIGSNANPLFPDEHKEAIEQWNGRSEMALAAGRAIVTPRVCSDPAAMREAVPPMPTFLKGALARPLTFVGTRYLRGKYHYDGDLTVPIASLREVLAALREQLQDSRPYLLGPRFTYADICMAVTLQGVRPVTDEFLTLGAATRRAWTEESLAEEFSDLIEWRDQLYEQHR